MSLKLDEDGNLTKEEHIDHHEWAYEKIKREAKWDERKDKIVTSVITAVAIAVVFWVSGLILDNIKGTSNERESKTSTNR